MDNQIIKRIKSPYPLPKIIVEKSTPVLSFGNFQNAKLFTLGINPSNREFENKSGELLKNFQRRLQTYSSLKTENYTKLTDEKIEKILNGCFNYFNKNPYEWFNKFDKILSTLGYSYKYEPYAAHVDLVQWSTKTKWDKLTKDDKNILIEDGRKFLEYQLDSKYLEIVLLNGRTVIDSFKNWSGVNLKSLKFEIPKGKRAEIVTGFYKNKIKVIGWSVNIQSSWGVSKNDINRLALKVKSLV